MSLLEFWCYFAFVVGIGGFTWMTLYSMCEEKK